MVQYETNYYFLNQKSSSHGITAYKQLNYVLLYSSFSA